MGAPLSTLGFFLSRCHAVKSWRLLADVSWEEIFGCWGVQVHLEGGLVGSCSLRKKRPDKHRTEGKDDGPPSRLYTGIILGGRGQKPVSDCSGSAESLSLTLVLVLAHLLWPTHAPCPLGKPERG